MWRVWFPRVLVPLPFLLILFLGSILSTLKTFCSGEFCSSYVNYIHIFDLGWDLLCIFLFYLRLWSSFLWFFFWRLCFYSKDIHPTIFKEENKVTFTLPIWHCVLRHMDKRDRLYTVQLLLPVSERLWFLVTATAHKRVDGNVADPTRLSGFATLLFHLSQNSRFFQPPESDADIG